MQVLYIPSAVHGNARDLAAGGTYAARQIFKYACPKITQCLVLPAMDDPIGKRRNVKAPRLGASAQADVTVL